jgi:hypothetical protein
MRAHRVVLMLLAVGTIVGVLAPDSAQAQPNPCALADFGLPGEVSEFSGISAGDSVYLKTRLKAGRSYIAMAWAPAGGGPLGEDDVDLSVNYFTESTCTTAATTVSVLPATAEPSVIVPGHAGSQVSIIPSATGTYYIRFRNNAPTQVLLKAMVFETTISSPWWFTGGTNQAYAEIRNNSGDAVDAQLTVFRPNGTVCGTINLSIPGDGNTAVDIGGLGTCGAALSGSAQLSFQGTPGGLTANITTINVVTGTSFDSPFVPRMVWSNFNR